MVCVEPGRGEKRNGAGAVGGARAIAVPRSSSSVMGCMIYVVDVPLVVRPFSTAAPFHSFQRARATTEAPFRARDRSHSINEELTRGLTGGLGRRRYCRVLQTGEKLLVP